LNISCRLELPSRLPHVPVRAQVRNQLTLAFQEALQNVVKHSRATVVTLVIDYNAPQLTIQLRDNGLGLPVDTNGAGKDGIANMCTRLASIGGNCSVRGYDGGSGTEVEFCVSLNQAARI
jgi:signal transduction histidine kinase